MNQIGDTILCPENQNFLCVGSLAKVIPKMATLLTGKKSNFFVENNFFKKKFFRKVKAPKLNIRTPNERHPSPPCPHQWESHEEIDKLEQSLKSSVFETSARSIKSEYIQDTIDKSVSRENHSSTSIGKKSFTSSLPRTKSNSNPNLQADPKFCTLDSKVRSSNHRRFENENISQDHFSSSFETSISTRITSKKEEAKIVNLPSNLEKVRASLAN